MTDTVSALLVISFFLAALWQFLYTKALSEEMQQTLRQLRRGETSRATTRWHIFWRNFWPLVPALVCFGSIYMEDPFGWGQLSKHQRQVIFCGLLAILPLEFPIRLAFKWRAYRDAGFSTSFLLREIIAYSVMALMFSIPFFWLVLGSESLPASLGE